MLGREVSLDLRQAHLQRDVDFPELRRKGYPEDRHAPCARCRRHRLRRRAIVARRLEWSLPQTIAFALMSPRPGRTNPRTLAQRFRTCASDPPLRSWLGPGRPPTAALTIAFASRDGRRSCRGLPPSGFGRRPVLSVGVVRDPVTVRRLVGGSIRARGSRPERPAPVLPLVRARTAAIRCLHTMPVMFLLVTGG